MSRIRRSRQGARPIGRESARALCSQFAAPAARGSSRGAAGTSLLDGAPDRGDYCGVIGVAKIDLSWCASLRWINAMRRPIYDDGIVRAETHLIASAGGGRGPL